MIKRLALSMTVISMAVIAMLLATSTVAFASGKVRAEANLASIANSGISAEITFVDNPAAQTLTIRGEAEGLNPTKTYLSLLYNAGSPSVGPMACEPTNDSVNFVQMIVGIWSVNKDGEGRLSTVKSMAGNSNLMRQPPGVVPPGLATAPSYVGLNKVGNMSVRDLLTPPGFVLKACGDILLDD